MDTGRCIAYSLPEMKASPPGCCEESLALQILEKVTRLEGLEKSFTFGSFEIRSSAENKALAAYLCSGVLLILLPLQCGQTAGYLEVMWGKDFLSLPP